uniref:Uncharacterized protein n=1 Tax=Meloidogyne javanica TaxID=6303 RepID=A0A915LUP4_MELJA
MFHSILALIWPSWQTVNLEENNTTHYHGLFHDCIDGVSNEIINIIVSPNLTIQRLLSIIILIVFYYYSQQSENRFIKGKVDTYEQHLGIGYFLQMAATLYHFIAFVLALFTTKKFY